MSKTIIAIIPDEEVVMLNALKPHAKTKANSKAIRFAVRKAFEIYKDIKA